MLVQKVKSIGSTKIVLVLLSIIYALFYYNIYEEVVSNNFSYMIGYYNRPQIMSLVLFVLSSALPIFYFKCIYNLSSLISFFTYIFIYVPFLYAIILFYSFGEIFLYYFVTLLCMILIFRSDGWVLYKHSFKPRRIIPFQTFEKFTILVLLYLLIRCAGNISFVNFISDSDLMYELRGERQLDILSAYLLPWSNYALLPFCLVYNLNQHKWLKAAFFYGAYIFVYMVDLQKMTLMMPIIVLILYFSLSNDKTIKRYFHLLIIFAISLVSYILFVYAGQPDDALFILTATIIMRMQTAGTWLALIYFKFFSNHPYTLWGHIGIVGKIFGLYPYKGELGYVVTGGSMNANANYLVTDGFAACGIWGIVVASLFLIFFKAVLNNISYHFDLKSSSLIMLPAIGALLNASLFTALFSFGFILIFLIFLYVDFSMKGTKY